MNLFEFINKKHFFYGIQSPTLTDSMNFCWKLGLTVEK
jgi:hypothetical protein